MRGMSYQLNLSALDYLKSELRPLALQSRASHRCEAFAKACGFNTYAALRAEVGRQQFVLTNVDGGVFCRTLNYDPTVGDLERLCIAVVKALVCHINSQNERLGAVGDGIGQRERIGGELEPWHLFNMRLKDSREESSGNAFALQVWECMLHFQIIAKTKTVSPAANSYRIKHIVEGMCKSGGQEGRTQIRYIRNGAAIYGAILTGFTHKTFSHLDMGPNVAFNMSLKDLKALESQLAEAVPA